MSANSNQKKSTTPSLRIMNEQELRQIHGGEVTVQGMNAKEPKAHIEALRYLRKRTIG